MAWGKIVETQQGRNVVFWIFEGTPGRLDYGYKRQLWQFWLEQVRIWDWCPRDEDLIQGASLGWKTRNLAFDLLGSRYSLFIQGETLSSTFCTIPGKICAGVVSLGVTNSTTLYIILKVKVTCWELVYNGGWVRLCFILSAPVPSLETAWVLC